MNVDTSTNCLPAHANRQAISDNQSCSTSERLQVAMEQQDSPVIPAAEPLLGKFLPPLLNEPNGGLSQIPQRTLHDSLQLVIAALEHLDAEALLDLELISFLEQKTSQTPLGPRVRDGVYCKPIKDEIRPAVDRHPDHSCVRYLHVSEVPDQYSIGIFVFGPHARIPLHDHPDMVVMSRVLYGDLHRLSLDLAREEESALFGAYETGPPNKQSTWFRGSWFGRMNSIRKKLPAGSKPALKNEVDFLQAPDVTVLYPYEGNLHEFVAGPHGAAVLDVLLPPYDNAQNRDCTFYNIQNIDGSNGSRSKDDTLSSSVTKKEPCFIIPTGQPENFHCISGQYRDLGEQPDSNRDFDETMADSI